jgi:hypothetical protein
LRIMREERGGLSFFSGIVDPMAHESTTAGL